MSGDVDRTLWVGNLSEKVTDELLYELFLQAGPLQKVSIAKERDTGKQKPFAFVTFAHDVSVPYTIQLMDGMQLFGRTLKLQSRPGSVHQQQQQQQQQQQHQQQQQQQQMNQGHFRNIINPYQSNHPGNLQNPLANIQFVQMNQLPPNPYMMNQPIGIGNQAALIPQPPSFHRSHTWHGNDLSSGQQDRDRDERNERGRDSHSNRERDRSHGRRRDERHDGNFREDYRKSPNSYNDRRNEDFESKRQKVLQKHDRMLQSYRREKDSRPSPPYHSQKRGRY